MAIRIDIEKEFTDAPGARYVEDGPNSGEEFYTKFLFPRFKEAQERKIKLIVNLDDTWGYASSFISGSFGKLSQDLGAEAVLEVLDFESKDDPMLIVKIKEEILKPNTR